MFATNNPVRPRTKSMSVDIDEIKAKIRNNRICVVDQYQVQSHSCTAAGWPRNTISALARCQTLEQYQAISNRLIKSDVVTDKSQKLTLKERFAVCRPRHCQMPDEIAVFAENLAKVDMAKIDAAYAAAIEKKELDSVTTPPPAGE